MLRGPIMFESQLLLSNFDPKIEIDHVMSKVDDLLDRSITGYRLPDLKIDDNIYDLSKIDFEAMRKNFKKPETKEPKWNQLRMLFIIKLIKW